MIQSSQPSLNFHRILQQRTNNDFHQRFALGVGFPQLGNNHRQGLLRRQKVFNRCFHGLSVGVWVPNFVQPSVPLALKDPKLPRLLV